MNEKKDSARVRMTKQLLRRAFTQLLLEKPIQNITVRELCEKAQVNRGTFYLHYKDVFDLLDQIEKELLAGLETALQKYQAAELQKKPSLVFADVFQYAKDNADMVQILLGENGDLNFVNQVKELVREKCLKDWLELFQLRDSRGFDAYCAFIVSGSLGLVTYWLENDMKESPEELARICEEIMLKGIQILTPR